MNAKDKARHVLVMLASDDDASRTQGLAEWAKAAPSVSDRLAKMIVQHVRKGKPGTDAICAALEQDDCPQPGPQSYSRLMVGLQLAGKTETGLAVVQRGPDKEYLSKLEEERSHGSTHPAMRVLSVAKQIWVMTIFGLVLLIAIPTAMSDAHARPYILIGLGVGAVLAIVIDAFKRRCRSCRKLLAGDLVSVIGTGSYSTSTAVETSSGGVAHVSTEVNTHAMNWRCVHCKHRWTT